MEKLEPSTGEMFMNVAGVVAFAFAFFAIWKVHRGDWRSTYAVALVLLNFLVPFAGPLVAVARGLWLRRAGTA